MRAGVIPSGETDAVDAATRWGGIILCVASGIILGYGAVRLEGRILLLLAGAVLVPWLIAMRPLAGLLILLGGTTFLSIFKGLPLVSIKSIHVPDLLLVLLFGILTWGVMKGRLRYVHTPLEIPYACLIGAACVSLLYWTVIGGVNLFEAIREFKVWLYYSLVLLVPSLACSQERLRNLTMGCLVVGVLASLNLIVGAMLKPPALAGPEEEFYYGFSGLFGDGGLILVFGCLCSVFAMMLFKGMRVLWVACAGLYLVFFLLKFHRHMYVIVALSLAALIVFAFSGNRGRVTRLIRLTAAGLLLLVALIAWGPRSLSRYAELSVSRVESLHGIQSTRTVTLRLLENRHAIETIRNHPLIGIGFAKSYRPAIYGPHDRMNTFIHNGFLWILLKTGWIGLLLFAWFSWRFVHRGFHSWRQVRDPVLRAAVLGSAVAYVGIAAANLTSPYFMQDWGVAALGMMMGISEGVLHQESQASAVAGPPQDGREG